MKKWKIRVEVYWPREWFPWTGIESGRGIFWIDLLWIVVSGWRK